jgi:hypothetical protein
MKIVLQRGSEQMYIGIEDSGRSIRL